MNSIGELAQENLLYTGEVTDTTPVVIVSPPLDLIDSVAFYVVTDGTVAGDITVEVSGNYVSAKLPGLNQVPNAGDWTDVTALFADTGSPYFPEITAIAAPGQKFLHMAPIVPRRVRITVTPSAGAGNLLIYFGAKGQR